MALGFPNSQEVAASMFGVTDADRERWAKQHEAARKRMPSTAKEMTKSAIKSFSTLAEKGIDAKMYGRETGRSVGEDMNRDRVRTRTVTERISTRYADDSEVDGSSYDDGMGY